MPDIAQEKAELRKRLRFRRSRHVEAMAKWEKTASFSILPNALINYLDGISNIAIYAATKREPDISRLSADLADHGHRLALPRLSGARGQMAFAAYSPGDALHDNDRGIAEPAADAPVVTPGVILCPLLGFDRALRRIGQGGGYYDRAFARYPDATRIGVAWSVQEEDAIPCEAHDLPLHAVMTECEWIVAP